MTRIAFILLFLFISGTSVFSQLEETLITIGNTKVSKAEFERIYKKNNTNLYNDSDKKSPSEYLELFIDFKLKVLEAETLKMDKDSAFINELKGYREELAAPYLTDVKYSEQMVKDLYDRTTKEVNASHILINVGKNATEEENKKALEKINKIREEIIGGKDFSEAAFEYSEDPSAKTNRGNLGYFTAFQMVVPFENAAFSTPPGQVSEPVKSDFGYHLIFVHDIRDNRGEIKVAHIMKMFHQNMTPEIKLTLKSEIDSIYRELQKGAGFAELAKNASDDKRSAQQGGEMPWFSAGRIIPKFSDAAFSINNIGEFTAPIETDYGFHIIKKLEVRPVPTFETSKKDLEDRIKRDPARSTSSKKVFIEKLKSEYHFAENKAGIEKLKGKNIGDSFDEQNFELFKIDNISFGFEQFEAFIKNGKLQDNTYSGNYESWVEDEITRLENSKLEEKYPDFRYLIQEYHDGILLFNISEEKIWNFAAKDSAGLQSYYERNKNKYSWEERFKGIIATCKTIEARDEVEKYLAEETPLNEISELLNKEENVVDFKEGAWEKGSNPVVDYFIWNEKMPDNLNTEITFVRGDKIPPEPKILDEARGLYVSEYQKYLEENWIKDLRKKYKIKVSKKVLKTIEGV